MMKQCEALLSLYALTGYDTTSALRGIGKIKPSKLLLKSKEFKKYPEKVRENWKVTEDLD